MTPCWGLVCVVAAVATVATTTPDTSLMEQALLDILGLHSRPRPTRPIHVPAKLRQLYQQLRGAPNVRRPPGNTVRSFYLKGTCSSQRSHSYVIPLLSIFLYINSTMTHPPYTPLTPHPSFPAPSYSPFVPNHTHSHLLPTLRPPHPPLSPLYPPS